MDRPRRANLSIAESKSKVHCVGHFFRQCACQCGCWQGPDNNTPLQPQRYTFHSEHTGRLPTRTCWEQPASPNPYNLIIEVGGGPCAVFWRVGTAVTRRAKPKFFSPGVQLLACASGLECQSAIHFPSYLHRTISRWGENHSHSAAAGLRMGFFFSIWDCV
jgi:hypothetical protein